MRRLGIGFGLGFNFRPRQVGAGGTPTPPFAFPEDDMLLGMGFAGISSFQGYYPFADVMLNSERWERESGSGDWTQEWGTVTAADQTNVFASKIAEGAARVALPDGIYTVLNPDGLEIGVGDGGTPNLTGWKTDLEFTFTKSGSSSNIVLYAKGSVTNDAGPICVLLPGHRDSYLAGDDFNSAFIDFHEPLDLKFARFMDWVQTYYDVSEDWTDAPPDNPITLRAPQTLLKAKTPYLLCIRLANRLNVDFKINVPARATDAYVTALATFIRTHLNPWLRVMIEYGNEVWNPGAPYNDARAWVEHLFNAQYEATPNGDNGWFREDHGLTTGTLIANFHHRENYFTTSSVALNNWPIGFGVILYVERIDDDNFKLYRWTGSEGAPVMGTVVNVPVGIAKLLYKKHAVDGPGLVNVDANYGIRSKQIWDIFDGVLGRNRCVHVLGTQLVNSTVTANRLAPTGVAAATDAVAVAVYYHGEFWGVSLDIASGQVTPNGWAQLAGNSIRVAIYAAGSTPTKAEVLAGAGTGYIGHRDIAIATTNATAMTAASALTGLTNGTDYECYAVDTEPTTGYTWMAHQPFTASASASTISFRDSDEQMAMRARNNINYWLDFLTAQNTAAGDIPIMAYECSHDYFFAGAATPDAIEALANDWIETEAHGEIYAMLFTTMAAKGMKLGLQFGDINAAGPFAMARSLEALMDPKRVAFADFDGLVGETTPLAISNISEADIPTEPSFPFVIHTFADPTLTYEIYNDDGSGNFEIVGDELIMVSDNGVDWGSATARTIKVQARNGSTSDLFDVSFATGDAWYAADALFAWDSIADSNNAAINPVIGGTVALTTGTGATVASGLWDMDGTVYRELSTALTARLDDSKPILIAAVLDEDNHTANFVTVLQVGGANSIRLTMSSGNQPRFDWVSGSTGQIRTQEAAMTGGKKVYWTFYDPATTQLRAGVNQTENTTHGPQTFTYVDDTSRGVIIGSEATTSRSLMKHGSMQVINRSGMTLADAKAIVAKMQTLHGI